MRIRISQNTILAIILMLLASLIGAYVDHIIMSAKSLDQTKVYEFNMNDRYDEGYTVGQFDGFSSTIKYLLEEGIVKDSVKIDMNILIDYMREFEIERRKINDRDTNVFNVKILNVNKNNKLIRKISTDK